MQKNNAGTEYYEEEISVMDQYKFLILYLFLDEDFIQQKSEQRADIASAAYAADANSGKLKQVPVFGLCAKDFEVKIGMPQSTASDILAEFQKCEALKLVDKKAEHKRYLASLTDKERKELKPFVADNLYGNTKFYVADTKLPEVLDEAVHKLDREFNFSLEKDKQFQSYRSQEDGEIILTDEVISEICIYLRNYYEALCKTPNYYRELHARLYNTGDSQTSNE